MRLAWLTDIHLEFLDTGEQIDDFCQSVAEYNPDAVLIGGDISTATRLKSDLRRLERNFMCPVYFVLGNHDCYRGSIAGARQIARQAHENSERLRWLNLAGVIPLTEHTALVGHDGWGDGRLGLGAQSPVILNDFFLIREVAGLGGEDRIRLFNRLGDEAAHAARETLPAALRTYREVIFLTHVPPFAEACWHEDSLTDQEFLPFFTCKALGDALVDIMQPRSDRRLTVLCGHTHSAGAVDILPNLHVRSGGAEYGRPRLQEIITVA